MSQQDESRFLRAPVAGLLTWIIPGLGHLYLGHRVRGLILLVTITATFWCGVAIGGVAGTVNPERHKLWFMAQMGAGGNTLAAYGLTRRVLAELPSSDKQPFLGHWLSGEVGVHYTGVAGLLNLLAILDAIGRADSSRSPGRPKRANPKGVT